MLCNNKHLVEFEGPNLHLPDFGHNRLRLINSLVSVLTGLSALPQLKILLDLGLMCLYLRRLRGAVVRDVFAVDGRIGVELVQHESTGRLPHRLVKRI